MQHTERLAADTILERGVRVRLPAPFFLRLFTRTIGVAMKQPTMGTLFHVARVSLAHDIDIGKLTDFNSALQLVATHGRPMLRIVAILLLRTDTRIALFWRPMCWWVRKLPPRRLAEIALMAVTFGGIEDFTTTIRLLWAMKITTPRNLSQEAQGS
jgi:hypothetical protein